MDGVFQSSTAEFSTDGVFFVLFFFPRGVLDEILNLIESVSEGFPSYFFITMWLW